jgi:hypothetical protein
MAWIIFGSSNPCDAPKAAVEDDDAEGCVRETTWSLKKGRASAGKEPLGLDFDSDSVAESAPHENSELRANNLSGP